MDNVNSEIQTDSEQKTQYSEDSTHVFETLNNEEKNSVEPSNTTVDDFHELDILESVHPEMYDG